MMRDDKGMQLIFGDQTHFLSGIVFTAMQSGINSSIMRQLRVKRLKGFL